MRTAPKKLKALGLGMCAFILTCVLEAALNSAIPMVLAGGILEECVKVAFALALARSLSDRDAYGIAGWIGVGFWLIETVCLIPRGEIIVFRALTLVGHVAWPMIGVLISRRKNLLLGIAVAGTLHQIYNLGPLVVRNTSLVWGLTLMILALLGSTLVRGRLARRTLS